MDKLKAILERRKNKLGRSDKPIENFLTKWKIAQDLLIQIERLDKDTIPEKLKEEGRRQYIISMITALEVFLKDRFIELINIRKLSYENVAKETKKFTMMEVSYILEQKLSVGEIIAEYFNFQNLDSINRAFGQILNLNFFEELKRFEWKSKDEGTLKINEDFYKVLYKWINLRHNLVHDINFDEYISIDSISDFDTYIVDFAHFVDLFIEDLLSKQIPKQAIN